MSSLATRTAPPRPRLYRAPLLPVAVALVVGIVAGRYAPFTTAAWAMCGLAAIVAAAASLRVGRLRQATAGAVAVCVMSIGAVHVRLAYFAARTDHIVTYTPDSGRMLATLRGRVASVPQIRSSGPGPGWRYSRPPTTRFLLDAESIRTRDGWADASGLVRVTVGEPHRRLAPGRRVELSAWIGRFRPPNNPGQHDWAEAARLNHQLVWASVPGVDAVTPLADRPPPWYARWYWRLRSGARAHLTATGDRRSGSILQALVLGERDPALRTLNESMIHAGTAHLLSISGLHLGVFLGFVYLLCRLACLSPRPSATIVLVVLGLFVLLAEPRPPLLRSAIMAATLCACVIARRRFNSLNALALATIVLLAMDPLQLFSAGFQLSFTTVTGLIVLHRPVRGALFSPWLRRRGLMVFRDDQRFRRWLHYSAADWAISAVTVGITAYITSAPLIAYHFGLFSPYAMPLSLLLLVPVSCVLIPGYVSLGLQAPMPNLSYLFSRISLASARGLAEIVDKLDVLPGLYFELRPPAVAWAVACYVVIAIVLLRRRIPFGRVLTGLAVAALAAGTVFTQLPAAAPKVAQLDVLAVGAGQCAILRTPGGQTVLLDAGTQSDVDAYRQVLAPFIRSRSLPEPTSAFISHANTDHYNALPAVIDGGRLRRVYLNDYFGRQGDKEAPAASELLGMLEDGDVRIVRIRAGRTIELDERTSVQVSWPREGLRDDLSINDTSLVMRITCDGKSVLLTGDIGPIGQAALVAEADRVRADVLIAPHHGGWEPTLPDFVRAVAPRIVVVSGAREPGPPAAATVAAREFYGQLRTKYEYYSTRRNGWVRVRFGRGKVTVQTMR